jgi:hypothetical protein
MASNQVFFNSVVEGKAEFLSLYALANRSLLDAISYDILSIRMGNAGCPSLKPENHNGKVVHNKLSIKTCSNSPGFIIF